MLEDQNEEIFQKKTETAVSKQMKEKKNQVSVSELGQDQISQKQQWQLEESGAMPSKF